MNAALVGRAPDVDLDASRVAAAVVEGGTERERVVVAFEVAGAVDFRTSLILSRGDVARVLGPHDANLRSLTAVVIVIGLLAVVVVTLAARGYGEASQVFTLTQGVLLGAFGWLYGSHGLDRAERIAVAAQAGRLRVLREADVTEDAIARLEEDAASARAALAATLAVPGVRDKIEDHASRTGDDL